MLLETCWKLYVRCILMIREPYILNVLVLFGLLILLMIGEIDRVYIMGLS